MSRFFVGQRVRLVRPTNPHRVGWTGRIREFDTFSKCPINVDWDNGVRDGFKEYGFSGYGSSSDQLEPILPEGHRACDDEFKRDLDKLLEGVPA